MFICLEGVAGAGKSTQAKILAKYLGATLSKKVFISAAFEGNRRLLVNRFMKSSGVANDQRAIMFLFQALHATQYFEVANALKRKSFVIADRWRYSFFAHHLLRSTSGIADRKILVMLNRLAFRNLEPEITILLDLAPSIAHQRYIRREKIQKDGVLEIASKRYLSSVRRYYLNIAKKKGWIVINATRSKHEVAKMIRDVINEKR
jgi:dTMP kinase